ncbi:MAG TPA: YciI family protein [Marmoricola sp.]|nr:YciI family protein [Marmoricola sp.]
MRYMSMVKMAEDIGPAPQALSEAMGAEMAAAFADGSVLDAGGLWGMKDAVEISLRDGTVTTVDGPYTEAKEVAGGYAIIDVRSHEEAVEAARRVIELHKQHWPGWEGSVELRRISEPEPQPRA